MESQPGKPVRQTPSNPAAYTVSITSVFNYDEVSSEHAPCEHASHPTRLRPFRPRVAQNNRNSIGHEHIMHSLPFASLHLACQWRGSGAGSRNSRGAAAMEELGSVGRAAPGLPDAVQRERSAHLCLALAADLVGGSGARIVASSGASL